MPVFISGDSLIKKWRNVKDRWMKHVRKDKDSKKSGAGASKIKKYVYHDQLQFLKKIAHQRDTESSINVPEGNNPSPTEGVIDDSGTPTPAQTKNARETRKRKRNEDEFELKMMKVLEKPYDEEETYFGFFRSMVPTLKTFTNDQFLEFQLGVLGVLKNVKAQRQDQGTGQVLSSTSTQYQQVHYPYPGSQLQNYFPQQQPQFPQQFSQQAYTNPYIRSIHPHTSTSDQYYPSNQQTSQETSNQQPTPPPRTPTPHRATATPASSILSLDFEGESNDWNI